MNFRKVWREKEKRVKEREREEKSESLDDNNCSE